MGRHSKAKGAAFERLMAKQFSLWWTGNARDDVFWRTPLSGGRATRRSSSGRQTSGGYGDLHSTHDKADVFCRMCTIEMKTGYPGLNLLTLLVRNDRADIWQKWMAKLKKEAKQAGTSYWILVVRMFHKGVTVIFPLSMFAHLKHYGAFSDSKGRHPDCLILKKKDRSADLVVMSLSVFFESVHRKHVRSVVGRMAVRK